MRQSSGCINASADMQHRMVTEWHFIPWDPVMVKYVKFRYAESVWKPVFHDPLADAMCPLDLHGAGRPGNSEVAEHVLSAVKVFRDLLQRIKYSIPINPRFVDLGARHSWFNTTNIRMEKFWVKWFVDLTASIKDKIEPNSRLNHRSDTHYVAITIALGNYLRGNLAEFYRMMALFADPIYAPSFESQTKFVLEQYRLGFHLGFYEPLEQQLDVNVDKLSELTLDSMGRAQRTGIVFKEKCYVELSRLKGLTR